MAIQGRIRTLLSPTPRRAVEPLVCLVEDYASTRRVIGQILQFTGLKVVTAGSGAEMDRLISLGARPDVFVLDFNLPAESGLDIVRRLRADPRFGASRMVAITGHGESQERGRILQMGFDEFIPKPFTITDLTDAVWRLVPARPGRGGGTAPWMTAQA